MEFIIDKNVDQNNHSQILYRKNEFSIDVDYELNTELDGGILINDIAFELDINNNIASLSGFCPYFTWVKTKLEIPEFVRGSVKVLAKSGNEKAMYTRINDVNWPVFVDYDKRTLCLGNSLENGDAICFIPGAIFVFNERNPISLWLYDVKCID